MECVILFRNPHSGKVNFASEDEGSIAVWPGPEDAIADAESFNFVKAGYPYQIVELDEL